MEIALWLVLLGFAILVTALAVSLYYRHKYYPILRQLTELPMEQEDKAAEETIEQPVLEADTTTIDNHANIIDKEPGTTVDKPAKITYTEAGKDANVVEDADDELFKLLSDAIRKEQLYLKPKFGRKELVERFHVSNNRVSSAFSAAGTSVPEFIRECRLEHARQLIVEGSDMTLSEIAAASGFVHASTFTVDFKNKYGTSPTKYRDEMKKEEK